MKAEEAFRGSYSKLLITCLLFAALFVARLAKAQDAATHFPDAARVTADYTNNVEAYVALNLLWDTLKQKSASPAAVAKRSQYYNASTAIQQQAMVAGDKAATDFNDRLHQLNSDRNFKRSILEKYHIVEAAPGTPPAQAPAQNSHDVTDSMIKGAFIKGLPFMIGGLLAMYLLMRGLIGTSAGSPTLDASHLPADNFAPVPDSLRVVKVPGLQYPVGVMSGLVLDKETSVKTDVYTTTTTGQVYTMGNQVFMTPARTTTSTVSTQKDLVWIKTPQGTETSWSFFGGSFQARTGHLLSVIARAVPNNGIQFLVACNHSTGQFDEIGAYTAHLNSRGRWAWLLGSLVGAIGFTIAFSILLKLQPADNPSSLDRLLGPVSVYILALIVTVPIGLIMMLLVKKGVFQRRNAHFDREYLPKFRDYLTQRGPAVEKQFGSLRG